jgi:hypothetical protein
LIAEQLATLESARPRDAAAIAILTSDDMVNIETGIAVRDLLEDRRVHGALPVVMRVFDQALSRTISALRFRHHPVHRGDHRALVRVGGAGPGGPGSVHVAGHSSTVGRLAVAALGALAALAMRGCRRVLASSP